MNHFVQYHNPKKMGGPYQRSSSFGILTNKPWAIVGQTVWLITSSPSPRRYFLCSQFVVDRIRTSAGRFRYIAEGLNGKNCLVEIGAMPWFRDLLKTCGNFGLGLQRIKKTLIIKELEQILPH